MKKLILVGILTLGFQLPMTAQYDLLLKGGWLIDPRNDLDAPMDVAVRDGKIAAIEPTIDPSQAETVLDVGGMVVTPGLVDLHVHVFSTPLNPGSWAGGTLRSTVRKSGSVSLGDYSFRLDGLRAGDVFYGRFYTTYAGKEDHSGYFVGGIDLRKK